MTSLSALNLLRVWEEGQDTHPVRRALALLDAVAPESSGDWGGVSIGRRDARLLELYEGWFGSQLQSITHCPACDEALETNFVVADVRVPRSELSAGALLLDTQGFHITYRLPNSDDLLDVATLGQVDHAEAQLLRRCVLEATCDGKQQQPGELPAAIVASLSDAMAVHDPGGDLQIQLNCPRCAHQWQALFDIVPYLWSALEDWAQRTLADVHLLARAYSWSEREILGLSATRRRHYVEMVQA
jgi:hypothetical protein